MIVDQPGADIRDIVVASRANFDELLTSTPTDVECSFKNDVLTLTAHDVSNKVLALITDPDDGNTSIRHYVAIEGIPRPLKNIVALLSTPAPGFVKRRLLNLIDEFRQFVEALPTESKPTWFGDEEFVHGDGTE